MITQLAPECCMLPERHITIEHRNKKLSPGSGISIQILKPDSPNHLSFQLRLEFIGNRHSILFGKVSLEIKPEWKNSSLLKEILGELLAGNPERVEVLQKFISDSIHIRVETKPNGNLRFYLTFHAVSRKQNFTDYATDTTKHSYDIVGWLRDIE